MIRFSLRSAFLLIAVAILGFATLAAVSILPRLALAHDLPAAVCNEGPNVVCPVAGDPAAPYIVSVTAVPDGIVILLTEDGLVRARECGGPAEIAALTEALYDQIPLDQRAAFQLDWRGETLENEIYGHAWFYQMSQGVGVLDTIAERSNPINIVFVDYGGPGEMTSEAKAEQQTFSALGTVHRAGC